MWADVPLNHIKIKLKSKIEIEPFCHNLQPTVIFLESSPFSLVGPSQKAVQICLQNIDQWKASIREAGDIIGRTS